MPVKKVLHLRIDKDLAQQAMLTARRNGRSLNQAAIDALKVWIQVNAEVDAASIAYLKRRVQELNAAIGLDNEPG